MKTVFSNKELPHIWANQLQSHGRANSMFFKETSIYSYGHHFKAGEIVTAPNGETVYFLNSVYYSSSTRKHQSHIRQSVPNSATCFTVDFIRTNYYGSGSYDFKIKDLPEILSGIKLKAQNAIHDQLKAKSSSQHMRNAGYYLANHNQIAELFNLPLLKTSDLKNWDEAEIKAADLTNNEAAREERRTAVAAEKYAKNAAKWLSHEYNGVLEGAILLRLVDNGQTVETSRGARVDFKEAKEMFLSIIRGTATIGQKVGGYVLNAYNDTEITIGCHHIPVATAKAFFAKTNP